MVQLVHPDKVDHPIAESPVPDSGMHTPEESTTHHNIKMASDNTSNASQHTTVAQSNLDASVSPYIPQAAAYNTAQFIPPNHYAAGPYQVPYPPCIYPPGIPTHPPFTGSEGYPSSEAAMPETNTSIPPPSMGCAYDCNNGNPLMNGGYPMPGYGPPSGSYFVPNPAVPLTAPGMHQMYPVPSMYYYYPPTSEAGEEGLESDAGGRRRSSMSTSSCGAGADSPSETRQADYLPAPLLQQKPPLLMQHPTHTKHMHQTPPPQPIYNTSPSMVHVENSQVNLTLIHPSYNTGPAQQAASASQNSYPASQIIPSSGVSHNEYGSQYPQRPQYTPISAASDVQLHYVTNGIAYDREYRGNKHASKNESEMRDRGNFRGSMHRGRGGGNMARLPLRRGTNKRPDNDRHSDRHSYSNDRNSFSSDHGDGGRNYYKDNAMNVSQNYGVPPNQPHYQFVPNHHVHPAQYMANAKKFEGPPLIMSGAPLFYPNPAEAVANYGQPSCNYPLIAQPPIISNGPAAMMGPPLSTVVPSTYEQDKQVEDIKPASPKSEHSEIVPAEDPIIADPVVDKVVDQSIEDKPSNSHSNVDVMEYPPVAALSIKDSIEPEPMDKKNEIVYTEVNADINAAAYFENVAKDISPIRYNGVASPELLLNSPVEMLTMPKEENNLCLAKESPDFASNTCKGIANDEPSQSDNMTPILEIKSEQEFNLSFTIVFGDLCPEDVYRDVNLKSSEKINQTSDRIKTDPRKRTEMATKSQKPVFDSHNISALPVASVYFAYAVPDNSKSAAPTTDISNVQITKDLSKSEMAVTTSAPAVPAKITIPVSNLPVKSLEQTVSGVSSSKCSESILRDTVSCTTKSTAASPSSGIVTSSHRSAVATTAVISDKPPLAASSKGPAISSARVVYQTPRPATTTVTSTSAWGKKKDWTEEFKSEAGDYRNKTIPLAVVSPMLFNGVESSFSAEDQTAPIMASSTDSNGLLPVDSYARQVKIKVGAFLANYSTDYTTVNLQPRGLTNKNYWCYANSVLQALVNIPVFVNVYKNLQESLGDYITSHTLPVTRSIIDFLKQFTPMNEPNINLSTRSRGKKGGQNIVNLPEIQLGDPFEPSSIRKILLGKKDGQFMESYQQDAEEMLAYALNAGNDEFNECLKLHAEGNKSFKIIQAPDVVPSDLQNGKGSIDDEEEWVTMGPKNKGCVTRVTDYPLSPISKIFWGVMRSWIKKGATLTANIEPFVTLQLDIQDDNVNSVKDALEACFIKTEINDFRCTDSDKEMSVIKHSQFEELPEVLVMQLKRFLFTPAKVEKVVKDISINLDVEITKDLLSAQAKKKFSGDKLRYKLVSIVHHDGKDANKGHYVTDSFHSGYNCWLHYDDACVRPINAAELHRCNAPRVPYLLFYRREDTFGDALYPVSALGGATGKKKGKRNVSMDKKSHSSDRKSIVDEKDNQQQSIVGLTETNPKVDKINATENKSTTERKSDATKELKSNQNSNTLPKNVKRQENKKNKKNQAAKGNNQV